MNQEVRQVCKWCGPERVALAPAVESMYVQHMTRIRSETSSVRLHGRPKFEWINVVKIALNVRRMPVERYNSVQWTVIDGDRFAVTRV